MTPEQLVPTLETCKLLKEIGFKQDTYFKHGKNKMLQFDGRTPLGFAMVEVVNERPEQIIAAAPTLQELLEELPESYSIGFFQMWKYNGYTVGYVDDMEVFIKPFNHPNPAEAAALLWLELHKEVVV